MESKIDLTGLVDTDRVIEVERIDPAALPDRRGYLFVKRAADVTLSLAALAVLAVPMAVIALAVKLDSPGPVFYRRSGWEKWETFPVGEIPQYADGCGKVRSPVGERT